MKKRAAGIFSLFGLTMAYFLIRYPLFSLHGMKQWPLILFYAGAVVIAAAGLIFGKKILPLTTLAGYAAGFLAGYFFRSGGTPGHSDLWIIWTGVYLGAMILGGLWELFHKKAGH